MADLTLKIPAAHICFIRLVLRSPDAGDGWRKVSTLLETTVKRKTEEMPELYETEERDGTLLVRLSYRGAILGEYLWLI